MNLMHRKWYKLLASVLLVGLLCGCSTLGTVKNITAPEERQTLSTEQQTLSDEQIFSSWLAVATHEPYLEASGITTHFASERKSAIQKTEKAAAEEPQYITWERSLFDSHYAITSKQSSYVYYGETKKNRPHGFGMMFTAQDGEPVVGYIGSFKNGNYDGYGILFTTASSHPDATVAGLAQEGKLSTGAIAQATMYLQNHVEYDGQWKAGKRSGKGNTYAFDLTTMLGATAQNGYWGGTCYPTISVCEYKKDRMTGSAKIYQGGILVYDGKLKNGTRQGKGVSYYLNGQKQYDGEWKSGQYNGRGTLYSENGDVIYKGKWKNGDYAS